MSSSGFKPTGEGLVSATDNGRDAYRQLTSISCELEAIMQAPAAGYKLIAGLSSEAKERHAPCAQPSGDKTDA